MLNTLKWAMLLVVLPVILVCSLLAVDDSLSLPLRIQVLNPDGTPAAGVRVGQILFNSRTSEAVEPFRLTFRGAHSNYPGNSSAAILSDEKGVVNLTRSHLFYSRDPRKRVVLAVTDDQQLMGIQSLSHTARASEITIQLQVTKPVEITIQSHGLAELEKPLGRSVLYFSLDGDSFFRLFVNKESHFARLPPGEYTARIYNSQTYGKRFDLVIEPGTESIQKTIDLAPTMFEKLAGKPAPEFQQIKDWYGSEPMTLGSLRGKVVILDFWGYWCGPCVYRMPKLFELYEKHRADGLVVIGIHNDSVKNAEELNKKLIPIREQFWNGRDVPFPIAIDGGGAFSIDQLDKTVDGATTAAYGIASWPTYILIDRAGNLRGKFHPGNEEDDQLLLELLGSKLNKDHQ